ncbi:MAG TPA: DUF2189 domain-containing protein [Chromatiaceae bacterium]|jgi:uncharacterized membrane protein|nr:MAG: hypothetical protein N838_09025 [Thiohalocapsa sp. PB-PSB1]QQO54630.1 MAG: DUF2189 domain-containing protein [Thiohalocapsa sp. PB-PSB1]HBG96103.1 DUF2189 domain-containing protein [Chromatiaceae bacterium]HCS90666.1 DUF2189 domain-containing protein [Chromatiaceae bacterium]
MSINALENTSPAELASAIDNEAQIRSVDATAAVEWLRSGWQTFRAAPSISLLYGTLFALVCAGFSLLIMSSPGFTTAFLTGLLLVAPLIACGLYVAARQHASGERISITDSLVLLWSRRTNLSLFGLFLALVMAAWVRFSSLLFAFKVNAFAPTSYSWENFLSGSFDPVIVGFFVVIGAILASVVFITSAVAIPMIVDRDAGPITAISASYRAVMSNRLAMILWASIIVALTTIGILTWFVGMIVLFPLLGYATWHSYRALVD